MILHSWSVITACLQGLVASSQAAPWAAAEAPPSAAAQAIDENGYITCEDDQKWMEVKKRLFHLLLQIAEGKRWDVPRAVGTLSAALSEKDFLHCPLGYLTLQIFFELALLLSDPPASSKVLMQEPWPETQETHWKNVAEVSWQLVLASRWPVFEVLSILSGALVAEAGQDQGPCSALWALVPEEAKAHLSVAEGPAGEAAAVALFESLEISTPKKDEGLPSGAVPLRCPMAVASGTLAFLKSSSNAGREDVEELLALAQQQAGTRWPMDFMRSPWPALSLLRDLERLAAPLNWRQALVGQPRGAVAYIHFHPKDMTRFHDIATSMASLERYWFSKKSSWPIVVFADKASAPQQAEGFAERFPSMQITVAVIDERDLTWSMSEHPSCSPGYRRAARFTAGPLWMHEALNAYSHILLVDTEFVLSHPVPWDPIWYMFEQSADLGYWQTHYEKTWNRTVYLTEVSKQFMQARNLTPQVPELVSYWWDEDEVPGGSLPVNIYGCLFGGSISFFRSDLYQSYFQELDAWPGFDEYCWSPQNILAIAAAFFLNDNIITELWVYGRHQNSSKTPDEGWNDSRRGILPQSQRPAHLQVTGKQ